MINVSIVLYNASFEQVKLLTDSLLTNPKINTIYLIDNSKTETKGFVNERVQYRFNGKNIGYGAGHNLAILESIKSNIEYHLVMNYDLTLNPTTISLLIEKMEADKEIGIIMPQVLNEDGTVQLTPKLLPTPFYVLISAFKPLRKIFRKQHENYTMRQYLNMTWNLPIISGCFSLFRVKALYDIGLYDDRFFMYFEDDDISRRIHMKYKTIYYPELKVIHSHQREASKRLKIFIIFTTSAVKYFNKFGWFFDSERDRINRAILIQARKRISKN